MFSTAHEKCDHLFSVFRKSVRSILAEKVVSHPEFRLDFTAVSAYKGTRGDGQKPSTNTNEDFEEDS